MSTSERHKNQTNKLKAEKCELPVRMVQKWSEKIIMSVLSGCFRKVVKINVSVLE